MPIWQSVLWGLFALGAGVAGGLVILKLMGGHIARTLGPQRYVTGLGQVLLVHAKARCEPPCPIHAPSRHRMATWPTAWSEGSSLMYRVCEHGDMHPDPDDFIVRQSRTAQLHGCDGCCIERDIT